MSGHTLILAREAAFSRPSTWNRRQGDVDVGLVPTGTLEGHVFFSAALPCHTRFGLRGVTPACCPVYGGLGLILSMDHHDYGTLDRGSTEDLSQRLEFDLCLPDEGYSFVHVHSKVPGGARHCKEPARNRVRIAALVGWLSQWRDSLLTVVATDQSSSVQGHSPTSSKYCARGGGQNSLTRRPATLWREVVSAGRSRPAEGDRPGACAAQRHRLFPVSRRALYTMRAPRAPAPSDLMPLRADAMRLGKCPKTWTRS
jgi:hypothetical protein